MSEIIPIFLNGYYIFQGDEPFINRLASTLKRREYDSNEFPGTFPDTGR